MNSKDIEDFLKRYVFLKGAKGANTMWAVGAITFMIIALVGIIMILSVAKSIVPDVAEVSYDFLTDMAANTTAMGATGAAVMTTVRDNQGLFWVIFAFVLFVSLILGATYGVSSFMKRRSNRTFRRRRRY